MIKYNIALCVQVFCVAKIKIGIGVLHTLKYKHNIMLLRCWDFNNKNKTNIIFKSHCNGVQINSVTKTGTENKDNNWHNKTKNTSHWSVQAKIKYKVDTFLISPNLVFNYTYNVFKQPQAYTMDQIES